jgi:DNA replication protein DnaC
MMPAYKEDDKGYRPWVERSEVREPGAFHFRAALCCPTCRCLAAHFPPRLCAGSFESFDTSTPEQENALRICREFVAHVNKQRIGMLLMVGRTGTGKTQLAANIVRELKTSGELYVRQAELTAALRATYGNRDVEYDDRGRAIIPDAPLEIAQKAKVLVLDEIGCGSLANDERLLLDEIVKHRYDQDKPTIFISNLPLDQFKEYVGDALTDRIRHAAGNGKFILQFSGESYRRTSGENYLEGSK